jgi:FO synthase
MHARYGHIQEVIVQYFRAKPDIPMAGKAEPSLEDMLRTLSIARIVLGPQMNLQAPPNLSYEDFPRLLESGINDWGGVSPVTKDFINPEAAWPQIERLKAETEARGFQLRERLAIYPEYLNREKFLALRVRARASVMADSAGYAA